MMRGCLVRPGLCRRVASVATELMELLTRVPFHPFDAISLSSRISCESRDTNTRNMTAITGADSVERMPPPTTH